MCAGWYAKAVEAGKGCPIYLKKTHEKTLKHNSNRYFKKTRNRFILIYIFPYLGPPPPSGVTQVIFWEGSLISHVLQ